MEGDVNKADLCAVVKLRRKRTDGSCCVVLKGGIPVEDD